MSEIGPVDLHYFLVLPKGDDVLRLRKQTRARLKTWGPATPSFQLTGRGRIPQSQLAGLLRGTPDPKNRRYRALHVLALAERTRRLYLKALEADLPEAARVVLLLPDEEERDRLVPNVDPFAYYGSDSITFQYATDPPAYPSLSHDICVHECVHALLDQHKAWNQREPETQGVAEAVGDWCSLFSLVQHAEVRGLIPRPSALRSPNPLSRFGEIRAAEPVLRDALESPTLAEGRSEGPYGVAKSIMSALYEAFARSAKGLADEGRNRDQALLEAAGRVMVAVIQAVDALPTRRVHAEAFAVECMDRASGPLRTYLRTAFRRREFAAAPSPLRGRVLGGARELMAHDRLDTRLVESMERLLDGHVELDRMTLRRDRASIEFDLQDRETQRTGSLVVGNDGRIRTVHLAPDRA